MTVSLNCWHTSLPVENGLSWDGVYRLFKTKNWNETNTHTHTHFKGPVTRDHLSLGHVTMTTCEFMFLCNSTLWLVTQIQMTEFMQHVALTKCYTHIQSPHVTCMCMMCIGRWLQLHCNTSRDLPQPFLLHWTRISWRIRSLWEMRSWHIHTNQKISTTTNKQTWQ